MVLVQQSFLVFKVALSLQILLQTAMILQPPESQAVLGLLKGPAVCWQKWEAKRYLQTQLIQEQLLLLATL